MRTAVALALSVFCLMSTAQPIEFKGVPMGAPMDDLRAMGEWYSFSCTGDEKAEQTCFIDGFTYANEKARKAIATFDKNRLLSVIVLLDPDSFDAVADALRSKYGAPRSDRRSQGKNAYGAVFAQRLMLWRTADGGEIVASLRAARADEATVHLRSSEAIKAAAAAAAAKPAAKKDL